MFTVYDVLYTRPRLHKKLKSGAEQLARAIVAGGRLRIETDDGGNYVRLNSPADRINMAIGARELEEPALRARVEKQLAAQLRKKHGASAENRASFLLAHAKSDMKKRRGVSAEVELSMARALVLSNALPVIRLIHLEGAEIFISFGFEVGDVMDVVNWQQHGRNSGLQAVGRGENAVYVSCGGDPFREGDERKYTTDGFPALARFMIIAGQETGHNADMIRGPGGEWVGRYSATDWDRAPSAKSGPGRRADIARTERYFHDARRFGLNVVAEWERRLRFYRTNKIKGLRRTVAWLVCRLGWLAFKLAAGRGERKGIVKLQKDPYPATLLRVFFRDMLFNLTPEADVYRRANPQEEEAIACIEALARVPQQVNKWGRRAVKACTPCLYSLYYDEVVPACERACAQALN